MANTSPAAKAHWLTVPNAGRVAVAIMAAGKGTRLKSQLPKVLHEVGGKSLLAHVVAAATQVVAAPDVYAIVGYEAERVRAALGNTGIQFVLQAEQRGTGHALIAAGHAAQRTPSDTNTSVGR
jgi:bifunctional UDP-N-acetylglucosamine pyrophosphorylase/glucosamine-1-phosphate N-acetyltransferase